MRFVTLLTAPLSLLRPKAKQVSELPQPQPEARPAPAPQQTDAAQRLAEQLVGQLQPLWLKRQGLDMDVRFKMGKMLWKGLYPSGQDRLPYGSQVMNTVGQRLGISRPDLHRMVKVGREFKDLATFQAQHPGVTTWDGVKKAIATTKPAPAGSTKGGPKDPSQSIRQRIDKYLADLKSAIASMSKGSKRERAEKRLAQFQAVREEVDKLLS